MAEGKKIIRLADVGELEADLKKDLAEEEAKGKAADILFCESISDELSDLSNLPTIDPESLRGHAKWVKSAEKVVIVYCSDGAILTAFMYDNGDWAENRECIPLDDVTHWMPNITGPELEESGA